MGSYRAIDMPHERIHSLSKEAVAAGKSGNLDQANILMHDIDNISHTIMDSLEDIRREHMNRDPAPMSVKTQ